MTRKQLGEHRQYVRERLGLPANWLIFRSECEGFHYMNLVDDFARTGDRAALLRKLLAMGVSGAAARWHLNHVGHCLPWMS